MIQGSEEWHKARLGNVTASRVVGILKGKKGAYLASRKNYLAEKVCEVLTGTREETFISCPMLRGTEQEPFARMEYEIRSGNWVEQDAFKLHPTIKGLGASPDGLVDIDGSIEIKNPNTATHLETLTTEKIKYDYVVQMQVVMMVYDRKWCDFVSFDDRLPENLSYYCKRFFRDEALISEIETEVNLFTAELSVMLEKLEALK